MKNRIIIIAFLAIGALIAICGYFVMPTNERERCFEKIIIGMKYRDADRILNEHGFRVTGFSPSGPSEIWFSYVHNGNKHRISISTLSDENGVPTDEIIRKTLHPEDSAIRRFLPRFNIQ